MKPAHVRQIPLHAPACGDQFGGDRYRNLLRRDRTDVEANRGMNALEQRQARGLLWSVRGKW